MRKKRYLGKRMWTEEESQLVREMYPDHFASEIAVLLNRSVASVFCHAKSIGVKSNLEKIRRAGKMSSSHPNVVASRFQKGGASWNKGVKMRPETYEKVKATMFQKGSTPVNYKPIGTERINVDGYVEVKVTRDRWRLKHRVVWEENNGSIPAGHNIQFKNGNKQDVRIENLYIIKRSEQMRNENSMHAKYPEELKEVMRLKGQIKRQINKQNRIRNGKQS